MSKRLLTTPEYEYELDKDNWTDRFVTWDSADNSWIGMTPFCLTTKILYGSKVCIMLKWNCNTFRIA